jgi:hypothetical protein
MSEDSDDHYEAKESAPAPSSNSSDAVHKRARDTVNDLLGRRVSPQDRADIRGAVDKADAPPTGRAGSDEGVGRAVGKS